MYSPEEFGELETFIKLAGVFVVIAGLRYEMAIVVEDNNEDAKQIARLSLFLNASISVGLAVIVLLFKKPIALFFHLDHPNILFALPPVIWLMSSTETLILWKNRLTDYKNISSNRVFTSLTNTSYKLSHPSLSIFSGNGLVIGHILAQIIAFIHISYKLPFKLFSHSITSFKSVAQKYKHFPYFSSPAALLNILAVSMPTFLIAVFDGQEATGHFANAYKLTYLPMSMLGMALGQVFFERIARLKSNTEEASQLSHQLIGFMFLIAVIPVCILAVWGDAIAPFILGKQWKEAGVYIQITILFYFTMFLTSSFSSAFETYGKLNIQLIYNGIFLIATFLALVISYYFGGDTRTALASFAVTGIVLRIIILNYFFHLFGKNLVAKTIFAIGIVSILLWLGFSLKGGF